MTDMIKPTILIVEDEPEVLDINERMLKRRGYNVITAQNVKESFVRLSEVIPDMLILDIMLPDGSGCDICRKFREKSDNPVIFLTGKNEVADKVEGLGLGADYYLTKPYSFDELLAVSKMLLQRHFKAKEKHKEFEFIKKGSLILDISKGRAFVCGKDANLTSKEFALLCILMKNEDTVFSPDELYEAVWGSPSADDTRTIRFHIGNLKKKINTQNAQDYDIISVYGKGYCFTTN